jgi:hypothetical protein
MSSPGISATKNLKVKGHLKKHPKKKNSSENSSQLVEILIFSITNHPQIVFRFTTAGSSPCHAIQASWGRPQMVCRV